MHRRGYRLEGGEAPLKENLAAAILLRAGWPSVAASGGTLVDPMCGSGTLLVEGAWMACDVAPGLMREYFGFLGWRAFDPTQWLEMVEEARYRREQGLKSLPPVFGYDLDQKAVGTARANTRRAGLAGRLVIDKRELGSLVAPPGAAEARGLVITNPLRQAHGRHRGVGAHLRALGERLKESFSGWQAAVFTGNAELGAHLGLRAHRVNAFYNGPLECKLLLFNIGGQAEGAGAQDSAGQSQRPSDLQARGSAGAQMFANRLRKNQKHLRGWLSREDIHCYRLYDADLPEYALAVDIYEDRVHVQEYAPPKTVDPVRARRRLREALAVIPERAWRICRPSDPQSAHASERP